jgi:5-methylcytosine-specific restriction endonuclease McrA
MKFIKKKCRKCGKHFYISPYRFRIGTGNYCSSICFLTRTRTKTWKLKMSKLMKGKHCCPANEFKKGHIPQRKHYQRGSEHPMWKGGITPINKAIRRSKEYLLWRKAVFERDNYACIWCCAKSSKGNKVYLETDHIKPFCDYPELRFAIDNGITFCEKCHRTFHSRYGIFNNNKEQIVEYMTEIELTMELAHADFSSDSNGLLQIA